MSGDRLLGLLVGFGGVALLVGAVPSGSVLGALAVVLTGFCYAASSLAGGRYLREVPAATIAFGTCALAAVISLPFGLAQLPVECAGLEGDRVRRLPRCGRDSASRTSSTSR